MLIKSAFIHKDSMDKWRIVVHAEMGSVKVEYSTDLTPEEVANFNLLIDRITGTRPQGAVVPLRMALSDQDDGK